MRRLPKRLLGWLIVFLMVGPIALNVWAGCSEEENSGEAVPETGVTAPEETSEASQVSLPDEQRNAKSEKKVPEQSTHVLWGNREYDLPWINHGGIKLYNIDDSEMQRLSGHIGCRLGHSFIGETLTASSFAHNVSIVNGEEHMTVNGEKKPIKGRFLVKNGKFYVDGTLLWYLLGMHANRVDEAVTLQQTLYPPKYTNEGKGRRLVLASAGSLQWENAELEDGSTIFTISNTVWSGEKNTYDFDDLHLELSNTKDGNVEAKLTCMDGWMLFPRKGLRTNELVIAIASTYPRVSEPISLKNVELKDDDEEYATVVLSANGGFWYHWMFDADTRVLRIDMAGVKSKDIGEVDLKAKGLKHPRLLMVSDDETDITRFSTVIKEGYKVEIEPLQELDGQLGVRVYPGEYTASLYDEGHTRGYQFARGIIVLDPGHGGGDSGCRNAALGYKEKNITLDVALRLRDCLEEKGWTVIMTRDTDSDVSWRFSPDKVELQARCDVANDNEAMWFISLHCNASTSSAANGSSIYWYKRADRELAEGLQNSLGASLGLKDLGLLRDGFYVLRHTNMPAVLIEMAFLSNMHDGKLLGQQSFRQNIAENIAEAIENMASER